MFYLTATTQSVSLVTDTAGSLAVTSSYVDITPSAFTPNSGTLLVTTSGSTAIISAPGASTTRQIKSIIIRNTSATVTTNISVNKVVSASAYAISANITLRPKMSLVFEDANGWEVMAENGALVENGATSTTLADGDLMVNVAGAITGAIDVSVDTRDMQLLLTSQDITVPAASSTDVLKIYNRTIANRNMLAQIGPSGLDTAFQPLLARNKVGFWCPQGDSVAVPGVMGFTAYTLVGTYTARTTQTTNLFTRMRRLGVVSAATAASFSSVRVATAQVTLGDYALSLPVGGFFKVMRFGVSDPSVVFGARMFVGMSSNTGAATNVEPSTLTNSVGVAQLSTSNNLFIVYGGTVAQPPIDLGVNFPAATTNTDVYELALFSPAGRGGIIYYQVTRLNTGDIASGVLQVTTSMAALPTSTTLLTYTQAWRCNNTIAAAVAVDIFSDYIETDQ